MSNTIRRGLTFAQQTTLQQRIQDYVQKTITKPQLTELVELLQSIEVSFEGHEPIPFDQLSGHVSVSPEIKQIQLASQAAADRSHTVFEVVEENNEARSEAKRSVLQLLQNISSDQTTRKDLLLWAEKAPQKDIDAVKKGSDGAYTIEGMLEARIKWGENPGWQVQTIDVLLDEARLAKNDALRRAQGREADITNDQRNAGNELAARLIALQHPLLPEIQARVSGGWRYPGASGFGQTKDAYLEGFLSKFADKFPERTIENLPKAQPMAQDTRNAQQRADLMAELTADFQKNNFRENPVFCVTDSLRKMAEHTPSQFNDGLSEFYRALGHEVSDFQKLQYTAGIVGSNDLVRNAILASPTFRTLAENTPVNLYWQNFLANGLMESPSGQSKG